MIKIRSNLNSSIEFSVKKKVGNVSETLTVKIERSNVKGKPEFLNQITEEELKDLKADSGGIFKSLLRDGKFQIVLDEDEEEKSQSESFSSDQVETFISEALENYKNGEGNDLAQNALDELSEKLTNDFAEEKDEAVKNAKEALESDFKTRMEAAVQKAVDEGRQVLKNRHNSEVTKGKLKKW